MDDGLGGYQKVGDPITFTLVSILLVMDDGLGAFQKSMRDQGMQVSQSFL